MPVDKGVKQVLCSYLITRVLLVLSNICCSISSDNIIFQRLDCLDSSLPGLEVLVCIILHADHQLKRQCLSVCLS